MTTAGFIGVGRMRLPMASNLRKAGFPVIGHDTDPARVAAFVGKGGSGCDGVADLARRSDIVLSMIMNDATLRRVALGPDGVVANLREGAVYADLSTVTPAVSAEVAAAAREAGARVLRGAVAGSIGPATEGSLTLFASGSEDAFAQARPTFEAMSSQVLHVGSGEEAGYLKLVHSLVIGTYSAMIGEALAFGEKGGLDLSLMIDVLAAGPLGSRQLSLKAPILKARDFDAPPSDIDTAAKDVDMILQTARSDAMPLPILSSVRQVMAAAQAARQGGRDIYAIFETFERLGGLR